MITIGRNGQPIDILAANGKKHLTKAEIQQRKDSEIKLGSSRLKCPDYVKADPVALKKWRELTKDYYQAAANGGIDLVKSSDAGILARYCKTFSEYMQLCNTRNKLLDVEIDWSQYERFLPVDFQDTINRLLRVNVDLQLDTAINKKQDMLIKMEDRLFLTPLAKVKNVPQKPKEDKAPSKFGRFGAGKSG